MSRTFRGYIRSHWAFSIARENQYLCITRKTVGKQADMYPNKIISTLVFLCRIIFIFMQQNLPKIIPDRSIIFFFFFFSKHQYIETIHQNSFIPFYFAFSSTDIFILYFTVAIFHAYSSSYSPIDYVIHTYIGNGFSPIDDKQDEWRQILHQWVD